MSAIDPTRPRFNRFVRSGIAAFLFLSGTCFASETRHQVQDAEPRHEVHDAEARHEVEDADARRRVGDAQERREVQDPESR